MKGVFVLKKINRIFFVVMIVYFIIFFAYTRSSFGEEGDILLPITFNDGINNTSLGNAIQRGGDLWIPESSMKSMGVTLIDAQNNKKGFYIKVNNPAKVFGIQELSSLAGESLSLYFA